MPAPPARSALADTAAALRLLAPLARGPRELAVAAYLDPEWTIVGLRHAAGSPSRVALSVRELVRDALRLGATAVVIGHGHPLGDPAPGPDDLAFTHALATALAAVGVTLADHVIVAGERWCSLRDTGVL